MMRTSRSAYQWVDVFVFREIWRALFFCNTRFESRPFGLLPTNNEMLCFVNIFRQCSIIARAQSISFNGLSETMTVLVFFQTIFCPPINVVLL